MDVFGVAQIVIWVVGLLVVIFLFLLMRQIALWYFRLNDIADNLAKIAKHTEYLAAQTPPAGFPAVGAPPPSYPPPTVHLTPAPVAPTPRRFPLGGGAHP